MAKASDNVFPKILISQAAAPAAPSSTDEFKFYVDSADGHFKHINSSSDIVDLEAATGGSTDLEPWLVDIIPMISDPSATTGTWALIPFSNENVTYPFGNATTATGGIGGLWNSSNAQNDAISWPVVLSAGTWSFNFHVRKSTNTAILTVNVDGSSVGTADSYNASVAYAKLTISNISIAATGKKILQIVAATRNASNSTGWAIELFGISLRRTA